MWWKVLHFVFRIDFVLVHSFDDHVRRVRFTPLGRPYVRHYGKFMFLDGETKREWTALTFQAGGQQTVRRVA